MDLYSWSDGVPEKLRNNDIQPTKPCNGHEQVAVPTTGVTKYNDHKGTHTNGPFMKKEAKMMILRLPGGQP